MKYLKRLQEGSGEEMYSEFMDTKSAASHKYFKLLNEDIEKHIDQYSNPTT